MKLQMMLLWMMKRDGRKLDHKTLSRLPKNPVCHTISR
jgi:hypothetical protein